MKTIVFFSAGMFIEFLPIIKFSNFVLIILYILETFSFNFTVFNKLRSGWHLFGNQGPYYLIGEYTLALIAFAIATRHIWDDKCYPYALERSLFDSPFYRAPWPLSSIMLQRKRADDAHFLFVREGDKPPANKYDVSGTNFKTPIGNRVSLRYFG